MKSILSIVLVLIILKAYSFSFRAEKNKENLLTSNFVEYDFNSKRLEKLILSQRRALFDISRAEPNWGKETKELTEGINASNCMILSELIDKFNSAELRNLLKYPKIDYKENLGLSDRHNCLLAINMGYDVILKKVVNTIKDTSQIRPYLMSLKREKDSMNLRLHIGLHGEFDAQFACNGDTTNINSLPVNIGPVTGEIAFGVTDSFTKEVRWCKRSY